MLGEYENRQWIVVFGVREMELSRHAVKVEVAHTRKGSRSKFGGSTVGKGEKLCDLIQEQEKDLTFASLF
jgi:hypothetical protein